MTRDYIFLGPPGSGKGTVGQLIHKTKLAHHLSTGEMIRSYLSRLPQSNPLHARIAAGEFLNDDETTALLIEQIEQLDEQRIIFDGYPRNLAQSSLLQKIMRKFNREIGGIILFELADDSVMERITQRYNCTACKHVYHHLYNPAPADTCECSSTLFEKRPDDRAEIVSARLYRYHEKTQPLINLYDGAGLLHRIDASQSIDQVANAVLHACT